MKKLILFSAIALSVMLCGCDEKLEEYTGETTIIKYTTSDFRPIECKLENVVGNTCIDGNGELIIAGKITSINNNAFANCRNLLTIELPESITSIGDFAFSNCQNLKMELPHNLNYIGIYAFDRCYGLTHIELSQSIKTIGGSAFISCCNLKTIVCYATTPPATTSTLFGCDRYGCKCGGKYGCNCSPYNKILYVPESSVNAYMNASDWKESGVRIYAIQP